MVVSLPLDLRQREVLDVIRGVVLLNRTPTHSVLAFEVTSGSAKTVMYRAVSMPLNCTSLAVMLKSGLTAAAVAKRVARADFAVEREMVVFVKDAATESQMLELNE